VTAHNIGRRRFLRTAGLTALAATGLRRVDLTAQSAVPNSSGTERPTLDVPPLACDCHHHIYDAVRFPPLARGLEPDARVQDYRLLQRRLGTTRNVIVTPAPYVTDNRVTLDAIAQFGSNARGVAVVHPSVSDAELKALAAGGIKGIRFALAVPPTSVPATTLDMVEPLARRAADLGWHVQFNMAPEQLVAVESMFMRLPATLVFDHMGRLPMPLGLAHPAFTIIRRLMDKGRTWVKLSVSSGNRGDGPPAYAHATSLAQAYVQAAPERLVWGSNWPHPGESDRPNDAVLLDLLGKWAPSSALRHRILVENPAALYGFAP